MLVIIYHLLLIISHIYYYRYNFSLLHYKIALVNYYFLACCQRGMTVALCYYMTTTACSSNVLMFTAQLTLTTKGVSLCTCITANPITLNVCNALAKNNLLVAFNLINLY